MNDLRIVTALPQSLRPAYEALLASAGLRDEGDADCTALLSSDGGALLACGSVSGRVLKQIAVAPWAEGDGACARIVTALLEESARRGVAHPFLYTKPKNARLFRSLGFFPVVETVDMLMMEHRRGGVERYIASLPAYDGESGAVVCHANPFTRGHRHLVEYAAARCDYAVLVGEKQAPPLKEGLLRGGFPEERIYVAATLQDGLAHLNALPAAPRIVLLENDLPDNF